MHESRNEREKRQNTSNDPVFASLFYLSKEEGRKEPIGGLPKCLNMSAMNVSRAIQELQELGLLVARRDGTHKMIEAVACGRELYQLSCKYLQSPVQKKIYVSSQFYNVTLPMAGETALAKRVC